jgi:hypothetical protein
VIIPYPKLLIAEHLGGQRIRLTFSVGNFIEIKVMSLRGVGPNLRVVDRGMGLDPGDGFDRSAVALWHARGKWLRRRDDHAAVEAAGRVALGL